jgi:hypothetical protein
LVQRSWVLRRAEPQDILHFPSRVLGHSGDRATGHWIVCSLRRIECHTRHNSLSGSSASVPCAPRPRAWRVPPGILPRSRSTSRLALGDADLRRRSATGTPCSACRRTAVICLRKSACSSRHILLARSGRLCRRLTYRVVRLRRGPLTDI